MQLYHWRARSVEGRCYEGEFLAESKFEVAAFVRSNFGYVTGIKLAQAGWTVQWPRPARKKITNQERAIFFKQLYVLLKSGIPMMRALALLHGKLGEGMTKVCRALEAELRKGRSLAEAMQDQQLVFPKVVVSVIYAGEVSGQLIPALESLAKYFAQQDALYKYVRNASVYPAFLLVFTLGTFGFFCGKVLPVFASMYTSFDVPQTFFLRCLLWATALLENHFGALLCTAVFVVGLFWRQRGLIGKFILSLRMVKKILWPFLELRFVRVLALLLRSGISLPEAIKYAAESVCDRTWEQKARVFASGIVRGLSITDSALMAGRLFSDTVLEFITVGESSGNLPEMLLEAVAILEQNLLTRLRDWKALVEPVLVVLIAVLVLLMVASVLAPMFSLVTQMPDY